MTELKNLGRVSLKKEKLIAVVKVECDDKNYRTMNEMRAKRSQIVAVNVWFINKN